MEEYWKIKVFEEKHRNKNKSIILELKELVSDIPWLVAMWPDYDDSRHWNNTLVLITVANTSTLHLPQFELKKIAAPLENEYRVVLDFLMYFPSNVPKTDENTSFIITSDDFKPNAGNGFSYSRHDLVNQNKIDKLARFADIWENNSCNIRYETMERLGRLTKQYMEGERIVLEEWRTILDCYDDEMIAILLRTKNRRMQTLAVTNPIPVEYRRMQPDVPAIILEDANMSALLG